MENEKGRDRSFRTRQPQELSEALLRRHLWPLYANLEKFKVVKLQPRWALEIKLLVPNALLQLARGHQSVGVPTTTTSLAEAVSTSSHQPDGHRQRRRAVPSLAA